MKTLTDAWRWYSFARQNLERMQRLGKRYWDDLPWETHVIGQDERFKRLEADDIIEETEARMSDLWMHIGGFKNFSMHLASL
jgi:hypothetical protein